MVLDFVRTIRKRENNEKETTLVGSSAQYYFSRAGLFVYRKRRVFGIILVISNIISLIWLPSKAVFELIHDNYMVNICLILFGIAFAYDAYNEAKTLQTPREVHDDNYRNDAEKLKGENISKLKEYLNTQTEAQINNENVRKLLSVSDATACRYLNELEKEGLIKQIGTDGPKVHYEKV